MTHSFICSLLLLVWIPTCQSYFEMNDSEPAMTYISAKKRCEAKNGYLASAESEYESKLLNNICQHQV